MITKKQIIGLLKWYDDNRDYLNEIGADFDKTAEKVINEPELVKLFAIPSVSGSLPIEELRSKLLSMRFSKEEMRAVDNEKAFEMYGFTDCINQLLEWLQPKRQ